MSQPNKLDWMETPSLSAFVLNKILFGWISKMTKEHARGIFVCYACDKCIKEKTKGYRQDIFEDCNYETCEQIDEDY